MKVYCAASFFCICKHNFFLLDPLQDLFPTPTCYFIHLWPQVVRDYIVITNGSLNAKAGVNFQIFCIGGRHKERLPYPTLVASHVMQTNHNYCAKKQLGLDMSLCTLRWKSLGLQHYLNQSSKKDPFSQSITNFRSNLYRQAPSWKQT